MCDSGRVRSMSSMRMFVTWLQTRHRNSFAFSSTTCWQVQARVMYCNALFIQEHIDVKKGARRVLCLCAWAENMGRCLKLLQKSWFTSSQQCIQCKLATTCPQKTKPLDTSNSHTTQKSLQLQYFHIVPTLHALLFAYKQEKGAESYTHVSSDGRLPLP